LIYGATQAGISVKIEDLETSTLVDYCIFYAEQIEKAQKSKGEKAISTAEIPEGGF